MPPVTRIAPDQPAYTGAEKLRLTTDGRIVDFLDPEQSRQNTPEERVRQNYAHKLHFEYAYEKNRMVFEAPINIGSETKYADIVIYHDPLAAKRRDQGHAYIIIETKAPEETKGIGQLKSYLFASSAEGGVWINETDAPKYLRRVNTRGIQEWPNLPRAGEEWDSVGKQTKAKLRTPHNLVETFKRCHNALYKGGIDSDDIAMDMVRIILAKYRDEFNEGDFPEFRCTALELQSNQGRQKVAERVQSLFRQIRDDNKEVFDEHERITAGDKEIATVVSELQDFRFLPDEDSDEIYDVVGAAYEVYVGQHLKGDRGQYFTHRLIVRLLVRLVGPTEKDVILDPAMGSGGFLIAAMRHVTQAISNSKRAPGLKRSAIHNLKNHLFGIDKSPKLVKVARTNMILASDGHSGLVQGDTLEWAQKLPESFRKRAGLGIPTVILTNPPFGATSEHKITHEKEPDLLEPYTVARTWKSGHHGELYPTDTPLAAGVPPEYLFIERAIQWVASGGKIGIVVPRGILDNDKALPLRTLILRETRILAVVNCHDDTFKPYTDAKTSMLVLEKKPAKDARNDDYPIFMAISQGIGHNGLGEPIYKTNQKGDEILVDGEPELDQDTDEIYEAWCALREARKSPSKYCYTVSRSKITENLNLNPVRYLPEFQESLTRVLEIGEREGWKIEHLGEIAEVFNGPRFKRPYADKGVTRGPKIVRYFTGNAVTQTRGENIKYLDLGKAKTTQLRMIQQLYLHRGMILITDSGTVGRVIYATKYHQGAVGTNNLIRVVIEDEALRGYVYQFLGSKLGQDQLKKSIYGAIVEHIEPDEVRKIAVPIPVDSAEVEQIGLPVVRSMELQEEAYEQLEKSRVELSDAVGDRRPVDPSLEATFSEHVETWRAETENLSSIAQMIEHPSYWQIVNMGEAVIPLILRELEERPSFWFAALARITGNNLSKDLDFDAAVNAWLKWGRDNQFLEDRSSGTA